jgi:hypothetical protein
VRVFQRINAFGEYMIFIFLPPFPVAFLNNAGELLVLQGGSKVCIIIPETVQAL